MTPRRDVYMVCAVLTLFTLAVIALPIVMAALVMESASFTCSSVTFSFSNDTNPLGWDEAIVTITNVSSGTNIYDSTGSFLFSPYGDGSPYTATFLSQPAGSTLRLDVQVDTRTVSATGVCTDTGHPVPLVSSGGAPLCNDGRINRYNCQMVAIYPVKTDAGYDLAVYKIMPDGHGQFSFSVSAHDLAALPSAPEFPLLVVTSPDGFASLYWLPSNEYQIIAGPDAEGKMFKFIFRQFPGEEPRLIAYMAGEE